MGKQDIVEQAASATGGFSVRIALAALVVALAGMGGLITYGLQAPALDVRPGPSPAAPAEPDPKAPAPGSVPQEAPAAVPAPAPRPLAPRIDYTGRFEIINGHDHLYREQDLGKYLEAAARTGIARTVFVASSEFTFLGDKGDPGKLNDWSTREILRCAALHPGKIITFASFHPNEPAKLELLQEYVGVGIQGLKLYTGHGSFYDRPLSAPEMLPIYGYCQEIGLPICWHVNFEKYINEFEMVMAQFPRLKVIVPHFGVTFYRPGGVAWNRMLELLDHYPSLYVDCSFGTRDIQVAGLCRVDQYQAIFRDFFQRYQDRIVWGTDMVVTGNKEKTPDWIASVIQACRDMVEQEEYRFWMAQKGGKYAGTYATNAEGRLRGLALAPDILEKIYRTNLEHILKRTDAQG